MFTSPSTQERSAIPAWDDIRFITADLKQVLDNFPEDDNPDPAMRAKLARAIAEMRDEKGVEDRMKPSPAINDPYAAIREMVAKAKVRLEAAIRK